MKTLVLLSYLCFIRVSFSKFKPSEVLKLGLEPEAGLPPTTSVEKQINKASKKALKVNDRARIKKSDGRRSRGIVIDGYQPGVKSIREAEESGSKTVGDEVQKSKKIIEQGSERSAKERPQDLILQIYEAEFASLDTARTKEWYSEYVLKQLAESGFDGHPDLEITKEKWQGRNAEAKKYLKKKPSR